MTTLLNAEGLPFTRPREDLVKVLLDDFAVGRREGFTLTSMSPANEDREDLPRFWIADVYDKEHGPQHRPFWYSTSDWRPLGRLPVEYHLLFPIGEPVSRPHNQMGDFNGEESERQNDKEKDGEREK